jgi:NhaP-type Na+/H+ or K+/H+ antiporter
MTTNWPNSQRESISYIPLKHSGMVWMSGLRGALNLALAAFFPNLYGNQ